MNKLFNVAVVGCGRISINHLKSIQLQSHRARIAALCDIDSFRIENAFKVLQEENKLSQKDAKEILIYASYDEMIMHLKEGKLELNWEKLIQPNQTIVFY